MASQTNSEESLLLSSKSLFGMALDQLGDYFKLATLELKLTMASIIAMTIAAVVLGVIVVCVWLGIQAISIILLEQAGLDLLRAIGLLLLINSLLAAILILYIKSNFKLIGFDLTIKHFAASKSDVTK